MNCLEFRRSRLSDPYTTDALLLSHRSECASCRSFESEIRALDRKIADAFAVEVPEGLAARILLNRSLQSQSRRPATWQWLGMAASLLIAVTAISFWSGTWSRPELDLVRHIEMEQTAIEGMMMPVHQPQIRQVLNSVNLDAVESIGDVQFASTCIIDGELVAHLVIKDAQNHYTLILVPTRMVEEDLEFAEEAWKGVITAGIAGGSAALLAQRGDNADYGAMRAIIRKVSRSITPTQA